MLKRLLWLSGCQTKPQPPGLENALMASRVWLYAINIVNTLPCPPILQKLSQNIQAAVQAWSLELGAVGRLPVHYLPAQS